MLLMVGDVRETLPAKVTIKWPFVRMSSQMTLEVAQLVEPSFTYEAPVRLLSHFMLHLVPLEVRVLRETFATNLAREGLFPRMNHQMLLEIVHPSEPLLANFALKRPFARVRQQMTIELGFKAERLSASFALEVLHSIYPL